MMIIIITATHKDTNNKPIRVESATANEIWITTMIMSLHCYSPATSNLPAS